MQEPFTFKNCFEDESLCIPPDNDVDSIPDKFNELIPKQYVECYRNPKQILSIIAERCEIESLANWLQEVSKNQIALLIHHATVFGNFQSDITIVGMINTTKRQVHFRLTDRSHYKTGIEIIDSFYAAIDGTISSRDVWLSSGWQKSASINMELIYNETDLIPHGSENVYELFRTDTGDSLLYFAGDIYANMHGDISLVGDAEQVISGYFIADLEGKEWNPFPY